MPATWQQVSSSQQSHLFRPWRARTNDLPVVLQAFFTGLARQPFSWDGHGMHIRSRLQAVDMPNI